MLDHRNLVLTEDSEFKFECHDKLDCFKKCCRDISIFLTPYDVLRLKNFLGISSGEFLDKYTRKMRVPNSCSTLVQIKMSESDNLRCPFITAKGCRIYQERPWSCRIAPIDLLGEGKYSFIFDSSRCQGLNEPKTQTVKEWMREQGLGIYEEIEQGFSEIPDHLKLTGQQEIDKGTASLFYLACYDLDKFRRFLMDNSSLLVGLDLEINEERLKQFSDTDLMKFGFRLLSLGAERLKDLIIGLTE